MSDIVFQMPGQIPDFPKCDKDNSPKRNDCYYCGRTIPDEEKRCPYCNHAIKNYEVSN
jgi:hypothetical protein